MEFFFYFLLLLHVLLFFSINHIFVLLINTLVLYLYSCLFFFFFGLDFFAITLILIYAGALSVLFVFVVMLTQHRLLLNFKLIYFEIFLFFFFLFFSMIYLNFLKVYPLPLILELKPYYILGSDFFEKFACALYTEVHSFFFFFLFFFLFFLIIIISIALLRGDRFLIKNLISVIKMRVYI